MMKILDKYIFKTIFNTTALVFLILFGVHIFVNFVGEIGDIGKGDYNFLSAVCYVFLSAPQQLYELFPMIVLTGSMLGLGSLANHHELIAMRAAGVSFQRIAMMMLQVTLILVLIATIIGEGIGPWARHYAEWDKAIEKSGGSAIETPRGVWLKQNDYFIHIKKVLPDNQLEGINIYQVNANQQLLKVIYAELAFRQGRHWFLQNVRQTDLDVSLEKGSNSIVRAEKIEQMPWKMKFSPHFFTIVSVQPEEMSMYELFRYSKEMKHTNRRSGNFELSFWQRLFRPFAACVMTLLAIPFVFRSSNRQTTLGGRLLLGIVIGFVFYLLNEVIGSLAIVYQWPVVFAALFPILLFATVGYFMIKKTY